MFLRLTKENVILLVAPNEFWNKHTFFWPNNIFLLAISQS